MSNQFYKVSHILVKNKYEAEDIIRKLKSGASFEEMAKKYSSCSSASNGGLLGEIKIGKADEDFEAAALNLKINEISKAAIRTKFGYHLIKRLA